MREAFTGCCVISVLVLAAETGLSAILQEPLNLNSGFVATIALSALCSAILAVAWRDK